MMAQIAPNVDKTHGVPKVVRRGRTSCTGNSHARLLLVAAALPLGASLADRDRWFCGSAASGKLFSHVELAEGKCYFTVSLAVKELTNAGVVTFGEQRCAVHDRSSIVCTACRACALSIGSRMLCTSRLALLLHHAQCMRLPVAAAIVAIAVLP